MSILLLSSDSNLLERGVLASSRPKMMRRELIHFVLYQTTHQSTLAGNFQPLPDVGQYTRVSLVYIHVYLMI